MCILDGGAHGVGAYRFEMSYDPDRCAVANNGLYKNQVMMPSDGCNAPRGVHRQKRRVRQGHCLAMQMP